MKMKRNSGFTLVELLVVIAIIALLVAIVFPAINNALLRGRVTATSVNGRNIYQAIIGAQTSDIYLTAASVFPDGNNSVPSGTTHEYFIHLVTSRVMNVGFSFFAAPGVPAESEEPSFDGDNNAWQIVDESEVLTETAPFLMTKNITGGTQMALDSIGLTENDIEGLSIAPFQSRGFAFVTRGGGAYALAGDQFTERVLGELFRTEDPRGTSLDNAVLAP